MVLAILQARMSSSRLPGKVMRPLLGAPMIGRQIERISRARELSQLLVATSVHAEDDVLEAYCDEIGIACFRGSLNDVLGRFLAAIEAVGPVSTVVRLTADCPLTDPELIDAAVRSHAQTDADYTTVSLGWTYPKGLDVEVCRTTALQRAGAEATGYDREHVTSYLYAHPNKFTINAVTRHPPLRFRWTVDTPEDFAFVSAVYADLYPMKPAFGTLDVLQWQERNPNRVIENVIEPVAAPSHPQP